MSRLDIGGFKTGNRSQLLSLGPADLGLDEGEFGPVTASAVLVKEGDRIRVMLDVTGTAHLICDRTSEPFDMEVRGTDALFFVPHDRVEALTGDGDDVYGYEPSEPTLDVSGAIRDTLVLAIPVRKVAPGAEELEITTRFGDSEPDIDPRWEGLRGLADND